MLVSPLANRCSPYAHHSLKNIVLGSSPLRTKCCGCGILARIVVVIVVVCIRLHRSRRRISEHFPLQLKNNILLLLALDLTNIDGDAICVHTPEGFRGCGDLYSA